MEITLSEIRSFHALVKQGNFTAAAKYLGVSQPAITSQIRKLESRVNASLLERYRKEIKPTALGLKLYHLSCEYIDLDKAVADLFAPEKPVEDFQLRVATASAIIFMPLMAAFRQRYPKARLKVISGTTDACQAALLNREADIGLFPMPGPIKNVSCLPFHRHYLMAILNPEHPLAGADTVSMADLIMEPIIAHKPDSYTQQYANRLITDLGVTPKIEMEMGMSEHVCNAVALGLGIGFSLSDDIRPDPRYALVRIKEDVEGVVEHVTWLKLHGGKQGINEFLELAQAHRTRVEDSVLEDDI